jgi:hypothetical protein
VTLSRRFARLVSSALGARSAGQASLAASATSRHIKHAPKRKPMRANKPKFLAPFILIASLAVALGALFAPGVSHGALADCPAGTNWDHVTHTCV